MTTPALRERVISCVHKREPQVVVLGRGSVRVCCAMPGFLIHLHASHCVRTSETLRICMKQNGLVIHVGYMCMMIESMCNKKNNNG